MKRGNASAIIGGDASAIIGGDASAIIGGDASAIIGGDTSAIIGGDLAKVKRGNASAIIGGDASAIIGGDTSAIIGGDTSAIIGGDLAKVKRGNASAIIGGDLLSAYAPGTLVQGPIEKIDARTGQVTILGQTYQGPAGSSALQLMADQLSTGAVIVASVTGSEDKSGNFRAASLKPKADSYTAGVSRVLIVGRVTSTQPYTGNFGLGQLTVDYTALLSSASIQVKLGQLVAVVGVQPDNGSPLQAMQVRILP